MPPIAICQPTHHNITAEWLFRHVQQHRYGAAEPGVAQMFHGPFSKVTKETNTEGHRSIFGTIGGVWEWESFAKRDAHDMSCKQFHVTNNMRIVQNWRVPLAKTVLFCERPVWASVILQPLHQGRGMNQHRISKSVDIQFFYCAVLLSISGYKDLFHLSAPASGCCHSFAFIFKTQHTLQIAVVGVQWAAQAFYFTVLSGTALDVLARRQETTVTAFFSTDVACKDGIYYITFSCSANSVQINKIAEIAESLIL